MSQPELIPDPPPPAAPLRALMLDDDGFDRSRLRRFGRDSGLAIDFDEVADLPEFDAALDGACYDLILVDYHLPEGDGLQAVERVRAHARNARAPMVMVAGRDDAGLAVSAMRGGCLDFLTKDSLSPDALRASITGALARARAASDAEAARDAIEANYRRALQGALARTVRSLRDLKAEMRRPHSNIPAGLSVIEQNCLRMWSIVSPRDS